MHSKRSTIENTSTTKCNVSFAALNGLEFDLSKRSVDDPEQTFAEGWHAEFPDFFTEFGFGHIPLLFYA